MRHMKLLLAKGQTLLLRGEVGWVRSWLGGVWRLEVLEKGLDQRQVLQFEWVIFMGDTRFICSSWGIQRSTLLKFLWCMFPGRVP